MTNFLHCTLSEKIIKPFPQYGFHAQFIQQLQKVNFLNNLKKFVKKKKSVVVLES